MGHYGRMIDPRVGVCAAGESTLQGALHSGLDHRWISHGGWAGNPEGSPHPFLFGAVTVEREVSPECLADVVGPICDSFAQLKARSLKGRTPESGPPWMFREPDPLSDRRVSPDVVIRRVREDTEVSEWERIVFVANGSEPTTTGELHPAGSQNYPGLTLFLAEGDGELLGAGLGLEGPDSVTVSAVAVLPHHRGQGIGTALTAAALRLATQKPATLSTSELGRGAYQRLGFHEVGRATHWG